MMTYSENGEVSVPFIIDSLELINGCSTLWFIETSPKFVIAILVPEIS